MKVAVLEFNKLKSLDEFSDLIQKIVNENNDLLEFKSYENIYSGNIRIELLFGSEKTVSSEVIAYGPGLVPELLNQLNDTIQIAVNQGKIVKFSGFVPSSKSPRSVCFLVLEKGTNKKGKDKSAKVSEDKKRKQNENSDVETDSKRKTST